MGDRANVVVKGCGEQVCLYTHWAGTELPEVVRKALVRGEERIDDYQYLNRIIFCEMVRGCESGLTGFGITTTPFDGAEKVITIDTEEMTVQIRDKAPVSIEDYVAKENPDWY